MSQCVLLRFINVCCFVLQKLFFKISSFVLHRRKSYRLNDVFRWNLTVYKLYCKKSDCFSCSHWRSHKSYSRKHNISSKWQRWSPFLDTWKPLKSLFLSHPESMLAAHFYHTVATPKMCFLFLAKSVGYRDQKITLCLLFGETNI